MKHSYIISISVVILFFNFIGFAQLSGDRDLQFYRSPDKSGINVFETSKADTVKFEGVKVRLGGASTLQFQGIENSNSASFVGDVNGKNVNQLIDLSSNFNLATANLDLDVQLARGVRMHLRTYLSSRHHEEAWVKGGYFQIDKLDFISEGFLDDVMKVVTIKVGHMENNYGDAHFSRSDNAMTLYNPFVGNYILDAFTTEVGAEVYLKKNGIIAMLGLTNGKLNQNVTDEGATGIAVLGKLGFDKQVNNDLRVRLTGSIYTNSKAASIYLYGGDRAGARYYNVMQSVTATSDNFTSGRWNPRFADKITAFMINSFIKYNGFELFGTYERPEGNDFHNSTEKRAWNQFAIDGIYRFGTAERVYAGIRYNTASGKLANSAPSEVTINRLQIGLGWFMTDNILAKFEYVNQKYNDFPMASIYSGGKFDGYMLEAAIAF